MIPHDEVVDKLRLVKSPTERRLHFSALLAKASGASTDDFIVVGGSAIEFYTSGQYTSGDIDIVLTPPHNVAEVLREWRFQQQGRIWFNEELGIVVDLVRPPYTGDLGRTQVLITPHGRVRIAAIEDLLVKRLASAKHWRRPDDLEHAKLLALLYRERIAWDYVEELSETYDVSDLLSSLRKALSESESSG